MLRCCLHLYLKLSLDLREITHSRPGSRVRFHQPVETFTAPCVSIIAICDVPTKGVVYLLF